MPAARLWTTGLALEPELKLLYAESIRLDPARVYAISWIGIIVHHDAAGDNAMRKAAIQPMWRDAPIWENHFGKNKNRSTAGSHQRAANTISSGSTAAARRIVESKYTNDSKNPPEEYRWTTSAGAARALVVGSEPVAMMEIAIGEKALYSSDRIMEPAPNWSP